MYHSTFSTERNMCIDYHFLCRNFRCFFLFTVAYSCELWHFIIFNFFVLYIILCILPVVKNWYSCQVLSVMFVDYPTLARWTSRRWFMTDHHRLSHFLLRTNSYRNLWFIAELNLQSPHSWKELRLKPSLEVFLVSYSVLKVSPS